MKLKIIKNVIMAGSVVSADEIVEVPEIDADNLIRIGCAEKIPILANTTIDIIEPEETTKLDASRPKETMKTNIPKPQRTHKRHK